MVQFTKLRLTGFKSFVDPTELVIDPGLTGIVGPNGCGKSNLVEALRWVMGETSAKRMRGGEMDDVIFAGNSGRPARNVAEVEVVLDNADRKVPAHVQRVSSSSRCAGASSAAPAPPMRSTARKRAPATCSCCSPMPPPARIRRPW